MTTLRLGLPPREAVPALADGDHGAQDDALLARLRDLALVDLDALVSGLADDAAAEVVAAHADDLADALACARRRLTELRAPLIASDPLAMLDLPAHVRRRGDGRGAAERAAEHIAARATAARMLARLDDLIAPLVSRYFAAERRRGA